MQLIQDFVTTLTSTVPTASVRPAANTDTSLPAVNYTTRGGHRDVFYSGSFGLRDTFFQVDIYTKTYAESVALRTAIVTAFHGFSGTMGSSQVSKSEVTSIIDSFQDKGERLFRVILEIQLTD